MPRQVLTALQTRNDNWTVVWDAAHANWTARNQNLSAAASKALESIDINNTTTVVPTTTTTAAPTAAPTNAPATTAAPATTGAPATTAAPATTGAPTTTGAGATTTTVTTTATTTTTAAPAGKRKKREEGTSDYDYDASEDWYENRRIVEEVRKDGGSLDPLKTLSFANFLA